MEKQEEKSKEIVGRKLRLGEILVKSGLINKEQLLQVLKRQTQVGGQLGSILIDMGFITIEQLLNFLSNIISPIHLFINCIKDYKKRIEQS